MFDQSIYYTYSYKKGNISTEGVPSISLNSPIEIKFLKGIKHKKIFFLNFFLNNFMQK